MALLLTEALSSGLTHLLYLLVVWEEEGTGQDRQEDKVQQAY